MTYKWIPLLFLTFLVAFGCQQTEVQYFDNGNKKSVYRKKGEQFHGESVWYYPNEQPKLVANYKDGVLHGQSINYYYNGNKEQLENYKEGLLDGKVFKWYESGKLSEEATYQNDTLHGIYQVYFPDGQIQINGQFHKGMYDGKWVWWNQTGLKVGEANYTKGDGVQISWYLNGKKKTEIPYQDNEIHGTAKFYKEDGQLEKIIIYEHGEVIKTSVSDAKSNL